MELSIVIPAYNEAENLRTLVPRVDRILSGVGVPYEILVVNNASTDHTEQVLNELAPSYPRLRPILETRKGFGNALHAGFDNAVGRVMGYLHADNQMDPMDVVRIYERLRNDGLDVCKATRLDRHDGAYRWVISKGYNTLFRTMFGVKLRDINGSPKLFTRDFFTRANINSRDWFIDPEIVIKASRLNVPMGEVEIRTAAREHGSSQVRVATIFEFLKNMYKYWRE